MSFLSVEVWSTATELASCDSFENQLLSTENSFVSPMMSERSITVLQFADAARLKPLGST